MHHLHSALLLFCTLTAKASAWEDGVDCEADGSSCDDDGFSTMQVMHPTTLKRLASEMDAADEATDGVSLLNEKKTVSKRPGPVDSDDVVQQKSYASDDL